MIEADKLRFFRMLASLAEAAGDTVSPERMAIYYERLKPYPIEVLERIGLSIMDCGSGFFPKLPEFINRLKPDPEATAVAAWAETMQLIAKHGNYDSIRFSGAAAATGHTVKAMGGWQKLNLLTVDELKYLRLDFIRVYRSLAAQGVNAPIQFAGLEERSGSTTFKIIEISDLKLLPSGNEVRLLPGG